VPGHLWPWLLDRGSLTRRLQQACGKDFNVQLLRQNWARPQRNEARALNLQLGRLALLREVRLKCAQRDWVFARTIIPATTLTGAERRLAGLGNRSLGSLLFRDRSLRRGALEIACLSPAHDLFQLACANQQSTPAKIWGRRSIFFLHDKPLMVCEFFLPGVGRR